MGEPVAGQVGERAGPLARRLRSMLLIALLTYAGWLALALAVQRRLLFPTFAVGTPTSYEPRLDGVEASWVEGGGARVESWFAAAPGASAANPAGLVVFAHGNGELLQSLEREIAVFRERGFHVMACEYRGYGRSGGSPSEAGIVADHVAALEATLARADVDPERLLFVGRSLGTGVVCQLAHAHPPRALVLYSPFTSVRAMMAGYAIPGLAVRDPFDNLEALRELERPVLVVHGTRDGTIPFHHGEALHAALEGATLRPVEGRGHNDLPWDSAEELGHLDAFLAEHLP